MVDFMFHSRDFLLPLQLITQMSATKLRKIECRTKETRFFFLPRWSKFATLVVKLRKIELFVSRLKKSVFLSRKDTN